MRYTLMHKELPVLELEIDEILGGISRLGKLSQPDHLPIGIGARDGAVDRAGLNYWWLGRSIPASRSGIKDALEHMGVASTQMLLSKCFGLSLSDQYWVKPENQDLRWANINFFDNPFTEDIGDILFGQQPGAGAVDFVSPDNTSDGMLRKRWKIIDGTRCLIKGGSPPFHQEPLNEVFATKLMETLRIEHVPYRLAWIDKLPYSVCPDFVTADIELVSAHHISNTLPREPEADKLGHYLRCCEALGVPGVRQQIDRMLTVDYLIANEDRHWGNFGALRNADTLEWIGPAPIFDSGTSLWHDHLFRWGGPEEDGPSKPFASRHSEQIRLVESFDWMDLSQLSGMEEQLREVLSAAPDFMDEERTRILCDAFASRLHLLREHVQEMGFERPSPTMEY